MNYDDENNKNFGENSGEPENGSANPSGGQPDENNNDTKDSGYSSSESNGYSAGDGYRSNYGPNDYSNGYGQPGASSSDGSQNENGKSEASAYGDNVQYQWNYDDYQKAMHKTKKKHKGLMAFVISICCVFGVAVLGLAGYGGYNIIRNGRGGPLGFLNSDSSQAKANSGPTMVLNSVPSTTSSVTPLKGNGQLTAAEVAKKIGPSVVGIVTYSKSSLGEEGEGSGIVMSQDGYIVTNNHVVQDADSIEVVLPSKKQYKAKLIGTDARSDLAVLKINATGLQFATFGNSSQLSVGDTVVAIGNPGGLELFGTVTQGIVSALNRSIVVNGYSMTYIQTDAAINPGNSGGALINMYGQVIGINSSKITSDSETSYEGIGFAIPVNTAKPIIDSLIKYGYVQGRVKLGITVQQFSSVEASMYNAPSGLLVTAVDSTSDAAAKGIQVKDIITKVNGQSISSFSDLINAENNYKAGQSLSLTIYRFGSGTVNVTVKLMQDKGTASSSSSSSTNNQNNNNPNGNNGNGNGNDNNANGNGFQIY